MLTLNLTSTDYSAHMTSWTKLASNTNEIPLKEAFTLVLMFQVVVCTEKSGRNSQRGLAHRVITDPVMQLRDKDTVVYIDNFFTSIPHCKS